LRGGLHGALYERPYHKNLPSRRRAAPRRAGVQVRGATRRVAVNFLEQKPSRPLPAPRRRTSRRRARSRRRPRRPSRPPRGRRGVFFLRLQKLLSICSYLNGGLYEGLYENLCSNKVPFLRRQMAHIVADLAARAAAALSGQPAPPPAVSTLICTSASYNYQGKLTCNLYTVINRV
jgi:hypothetical protein